MQLAAFGNSKALLSGDAGLQALTNADDIAEGVLGTMAACGLLLMLH